MVMTDGEVVGALLAAKTLGNSPELEALGVEIGKLYTDHGLPVDIALSELNKKRPLSSGQKLLVLDGACQWLIQHKRNSGATEESIERQRQTNRELLRRFLTKGEVGVY
jgi:hypothetical protein